MVKQISMMIAAGTLLVATHAYAGSKEVVYTDQARGLYGAPASGLVAASGCNEHSEAMVRGMTHDQAREATTIARPAPRAEANLHSEAMARGLTHDQAVAFTTHMGDAAGR